MILSVVLFAKLEGPSNPRLVAMLLPLCQRNASAEVKRSNKRAAVASAIALVINIAIAVAYYFYLQKRMAQWQQSTSIPVRMHTPVYQH